MDFKVIDNYDFIRSGRDVFYPHDRKEIFGQGGGTGVGGRQLISQDKVDLHDEATVARVKPDPSLVSRKLANLPFHNQNR